MDTSSQSTRYQRVSLKNRILLSLNAGCLITSMLYLLFVLAVVNMARKSGPGWERLYDVVTTLCSPAIHCSTYIHSTGLGEGLGSIWLIVVCNAIIYSFAILVISSI